MTYAIYWKHADTVTTVDTVADLFDVIADVYVNENTRLEIADDDEGVWHRIRGPYDRFDRVRGPKRHTIPSN